MQGKTAQAPSGEQAEYARAFPDCKSHRTPLADSHCPDTGVRHGYIVCDAYSGRTSAYGQDVREKGIVPVRCLYEYLGLSVCSGNFSMDRSLSLLSSVFAGR